MYQLEGMKHANYTYTLKLQENHKIISQHSIRRIKYFAHLISHHHQYISTGGLYNRSSSSSYK